MKYGKAYYKMPKFDTEYEALLQNKEKGNLDDKQFKAQLDELKFSKMMYIIYTNKMVESTAKKIKSYARNSDAILKSFKILN
jgi:hypothetical protein